ncbi:MAG: hypothetical protein GY854_17515 [Deltaproteobacteria bacterium]|nr:hypothetical protein [Deltaproteobacteria bacterium]
MIKLFYPMMLLIVVFLWAGCSSDQNKDDKDAGLDGGGDSDGDTDTDTDTDADADADADADSDTDGDTDTDADADADTDTDTDTDTDVDADAGDDGGNPYEKGCIRYVDLAAELGSEDGTSWVDAYLTFHEGLDDAALSVPFCPDGVQVWVARGVYLPDTTGLSDTTARTAMFELVPGLHVYGGFVGTETALAERVLSEENASVLSGDLNGDDGDVDAGDIFDNYDDNTYRVVVGADDVIFDGFTIRGGTGDGGGMYNHEASPTVRNCVFEENAGGKGGGMYIYNASPTVEHCAFENNRGTDGAGLYIEGGAPKVTSCTFTGNTATGSGGGVHNLGGDPRIVNCVFIDNQGADGAGIYNESGAPTLINCAINENTATGSGGGMHNLGGDPRIVNCTFLSNQATDGGGMYSSGGSDVINCTFNGNTATGSGGGMYNSGASTNVTNCVLFGDSPDEIHDDSATPIVTYSAVEGGYPGAGNIASDPYFVGTTGHFAHWSPCIDSGNSDALPADSDDIDDDGNTTEILPIDLDGKDRVISTHVDMGAYESSASGGCVVYVNGNSGAGDDANTGSSWTDALATVQEGINNASSMVAGTDNGIHSCEVWVAALESGNMYLPTRDSSGSDTPSNARTKTFMLAAGVAVYGGFDGTETAVGDRSPATNPTVLGGDLGVADDATDNTYHVVTGVDISLIDGFTVTGGYANGSTPDDRGAGMYNDGVSPIVTNCIFASSSAWYGGGMYNNSASPLLTDCTFNSNSAWNYSTRNGYGGGMYNNASAPELIDCTFDSNLAVGGNNNVPVNTGGNGYGGGMYNNASSPTLTGCTFKSNSATGDANASNNLGGEGRGGGIYNSGASDPVLTDCAFDSNSAIGGNNESTSGCDSLMVMCNGGEGRGGGMYNETGSTPTLTDCTFDSNSAVGGDNNVTGFVDYEFGGSGLGGGIFNESGSTLTLTGCTFDSNGATGGAGCSCSGCDCDGGRGFGGAMYNNDATITVTDSVFDSNAATGGAGCGGVPCEGGQAYGGGMYNDYSSTAALTLTGCTFDSNAAHGGFIGNGWGYPSYGGGMHNYIHDNGNAPALTGCIFDSNLAIGGDTDTDPERGIGGGMSNEIETNGSSPALTNCVFQFNSAHYGGGMYNEGSSSGNDTYASPKLTNCTLKSNSAKNEGGGMYNSRYSTPALTNCILWANTAPDGPQMENINAVDSVPVVRYSDVEGHCWSIPGNDCGFGSTNIAEDPLFVLGTLRLSNSSPVIDVGLDSAIPSGITTDLNGDPRIVDISGAPSGGDDGSFVDMGAYEYWIGCGNNLIEAGEACDDDNVANGDGCSATCQCEQQGNAAGPGCPAESCAALLAAHPGTPDGFYWIDPTTSTGDPFRIYCHDMAGTPTEYLKLEITGDDANFSQFTAGWGTSGTDVITHYEKVRLDISTFVVVIEDMTFATSEGSLTHEAQELTSMPYATAMAYTGYNDATGLANIDLAGTPFAVDATGFLAQGTNFAGYSDPNTGVVQVIDLHGGGAPGWFGVTDAMGLPFTPAGTLPLQFLP